MALCEFDEEIILEGVDELKTDLSDYMLLSDAFVKEPRLFTITSYDASLIRLMGRKTVTVSGTRTNFTVYDNTTPKLPPPPPLISQNRSSPIRIHDPRVDDVIHGEPVPPEHVAVPSAADVPADAHRGTTSTGNT
ncbi:hypothetical protein G2W53_009730 [Senna tora]|uniref:Uncharacterized protein n=1 Tax=Senna tora TaxID=362788 RepID=A0A835CAH1_9FABA|nr:hypothetical protein G2W53_009730 [Senna tora]